MSASGILPFGRVEGCWGPKPQTLSPGVGLQGFGGFRDSGRRFDLRP